MGRKNQAFTSKLLKNGFTLSGKPQVIFSYGGDGTLLYAERIFPGVLKLPIRSKEKCKTCSRKKSTKIHRATEKIYCESSLQEIIKRQKQGKYSIQEFDKVKATAFAGRKQTLTGLNEIQIHNSNHSHAIRFEFCLNKACIDKEIIGDGVVVATAYGSTAYFYAITRKKFKNGFGIAFNNTIQKHKPFFANKFKAEILINRRDAVVLADNNPKAIPLKKGDRVVIEPAKEKARIIKF